MKIKPIAVQHIEKIAFELALATMGWNEPIPSFQTRFPKVLESCLAMPFQGYKRKQFYPSLTDKAAVLFYLIIKNHPFQNGNKRIAITTLLVFLVLNHKWMKTDEYGLYKFAVWVAESPAETKDGTQLAIKGFIEKYLVDFPTQNR